ncbi:MAG: zinc ABC transporter substrate-binding protein [Rhodospirillales bacterium]|jgi:zinc transport system substrate-binding protein
MQRLSILLLSLLFSTAVEAAENKLAVLVSIPPLHSLAASVMAGAGSPDLLMPGSASPHDFSLKPSQAKQIQKADLVVWVGPDMEGFLVKPLKGLKDKGKLLTMSAVPGMTKLEPREGGPWEAHEHEALQGHAHGELETDGHLWLDIGNARLLAGALALKLSALDSAQADLYRQNAKALDARLEQLDAFLKRDLAPLSGQSYVVYHDALQYFERRYGLTPAGSITLEERKPSAKTIAKLRQKITKLGAKCVFKEPQAPARPAEMLAEGLPVRIGSLDDLGAAIEPGPALYERLLQDLSASLRGCLAVAPAGG